MFVSHAAGAGAAADPAAARGVVGDALKARAVNTPAVYAALATLTTDIERQVKDYGAIKAVPAAPTQNVRNDMYLASDAVRVMGAKPSGFSEATWPS